MAAAAPTVRAMGQEAFARCSLIALAVGFTAPALARADAPAPVRRINLAISGGASLGAYEGGFLYVLLEDLRRLSPLVQQRSISGTSAGAINAFLAVLQACSEPPTKVTDSAFYRTWMPIGFEALFDGRSGDSVAALSRSALSAPINDLREEFHRGLNADCDLLLGLTATRVEPYIVRTGQGHLRLPRMAARFLLRVQGQGFGQPPRVTNHCAGRIEPFLASPSTVPRPTRSKR